MTLMSLGAKLQLKPGSWSQFVYDICIGAAVGACHSFYIIAKWWYERVFREILVAFNVDIDSFEDRGENDTLKVVAVGYGRTGTVSTIQCQFALLLGHGKNKEMILKSVSIDVPIACFRIKSITHVIIHNNFLCQLSLFKNSTMVSGLSL